VNLGISKTWNFGAIHSAKSAANSNQKASGQNAAPAAPSASVKPAPGGPSAGGGAPPAKVAAAGAGIPGVGPGGLGGARTPEAKRYSMQFTINFQNMFNRVNLFVPEGNLSSPNFGQSLQLNGFGGFGGPGGAGAGNRRIFARLRFNF
jgi:hypothetical protein